MQYIFLSNGKKQITYLFQLRIKFSILSDIRIVFVDYLQALALIIYISCLFQSSFIFVKYFVWESATCITKSFSDFYRWALKSYLSSYKFIV